MCDEIPDNVVGILNAKDYFRLTECTRESMMEQAVRSVQFVPETVHADLLFNTMKKSRNHFAVVLDEYGGMCGVVTMNDLLEQLVGNLDDDMMLPVAPPLIENIDSRTWLIRGAAALSDVEGVLELELPTNIYDTFSGFVFGMLGMIPKDGETPILEYHCLSIQINEIKEHKLEMATVRRKNVDHSVR